MISDTVFADKSVLLTSRSTDIFVVYRFRDASGEIIYIGRSTNPRSRVSTHRSAPWFADAASLEWAEVADEATMVTEEAQLIHAHHPRGNAMCPLCGYYYEQRMKDRLPKQAAPTKTDDWAIGSREYYLDIARKRRAEQERLLANGELEEWPARYAMKTERLLGVLDQISDEVAL